MTTPEPTDNPWLTNAECAKICGITPGAWRRAASSSPSRQATAHIEPHEHRYDPDTGQSEWRRSAAERYRDRPVRGTRAATSTESLDVHGVIARAAAYLDSRRLADIERRTGLTQRAIQRHLTGECACPKPSAEVA